MINGSFHYGNNDMVRALPSTTALRVFEACGRLGSCTRAATELCMTPGAVSKQLRALEAVLGLPLFERMPAGLLLTPAGDAYLRDVQPLLAQLGAAAVRARQARSGRQTLLLHVLPSLADRWLLPHFAAFTSAHPGIDVQFTNRLGGEGIEAPPDASFVYGDGVWPGFEAEYLVGRRLRVLASPSLLARNGAMRGPRDLLDMPLLEHFELPQAWREFFAAVGLRPRAMPPTVRYGFFSVVIRAALTGLGVALVPEILVREELRSGALVNPGELGYTSRSGYFLAYRAAQRNEPTLGAFRTWVKTLALQTDARPGPAANGTRSSRGGRVVRR